MAKSKSARKARQLKRAQDKETREKAEKLAKLDLGQRTNESSEEVETIYEDKDRQRMRGKSKERGKRTEKGKSKEKGKRRETEEDDSGDEGSSASDSGSNGKEKEKEKDINSNEKGKPKEKDFDPKTKGKGKEKDTDSKSQGQGKDNEEKDKRKGNRDMTDPRTVQAVQVSLKSIPEFRGDWQANPKAFLDDVNELREDVFELFSVEEEIVDRICMVEMKSKLPAKTEAGEWYQEWRRTEDKDKDKVTWGRFVDAFTAKFLSDSAAMKRYTHFSKRDIKADESPEDYKRALKTLGGLVGADAKVLLARFLDGIDAQMRKDIKLHGVHNIDMAAEKAMVVYEGRADEAKEKEKEKPKALVAKGERGRASFNEREKLCFGCGKPGHFKRDCPTASGTTRGGWSGGAKKSSSSSSTHPSTGEDRCYRCGQEGHIALGCRKVLKKAMRAVEEQEAEEKASEEEENKEEYAYVSKETIGMLSYVEVKLGGAIRVIAIDMGATTTLLPMEAAEEIVWVPSAKTDQVGGIGDGLLSDVKWGTTMVEVGGARKEIEVGFTDGLQGEPGLLSLHAADTLGIVFDYEKKRARARGGMWIPIVMRRPATMTFAAVAKNFSIEPGEAKWIDLRVDVKGEKDVFMEPGILDRARVVEGIWTAREGLVRLAIINESERPLTWKEGDRLAAWTEVKEGGGKEAGQRAFEARGKRKGKENEEKGEEKKEKIRRQREEKRVLITDGEIDEYCREHLAHLSETEVEKVKEAILKPNREIFLRRGELPVNPIRYPAVVLEVTANPKIAAVRPWNQQKYEIAEKENQRLVEANISVESKSPFRSEPVFVEKKDGSTRMTIDYRGTLNKVLVFDAYPIPRIDEQVRKMAGCGVFTSVDAASSFWQIELAKESRQLTAYRAPPGNHYESTRLPQGATVGSAVLCRAVQKTIIDKLSPGTRGNVAHYVDEFLVGSELGEGEVRFDSHFRMVKELFEAFKAGAWRIGWHKLTLFQFTAEWVGMKISKEGHASAISLVKAILESQEPANQTELRRFLGKTTYQAARIKDYKIIAKPLFRLLGDVPYEFGEAERESWRRLRTALAVHPVLGIIKPGKGVSIKVYSDASQIGIGAELHQDGRVCGYFNRSLTEREQRYSTIDRELMGAAEATLFFAPMVGNSDMDIMSDHKPLTDGGWRGLPLEPAPDRAKDRPKWVGILDTHRVNVKYIRGADNPSDALTRRPFVGIAIAGRQRTSEEWAARQKEDPETLRWHSYITKDVLPTNAKWAKSMIVERSNYDVVDDVVVTRRVPHAHAQKDEEEWLIVVPHQDHAEVLKEFHDKLGHPSAAATAHKITSAGLYFKGYWAAAKKHKKECTLCAELKEINNDDKVGFLEPTMKADRDIRVLAIDFAGPMHATDQGNTHLIISLTEDDMWVDAKAIQEPTTAAVLDHLTERAASEDAWDIIKSDRGSQLVSAAATAFYEDAGIEPHPTTANNPRANGSAEATVKILKRHIEKLAFDYPATWDKKLPIALAFIRNDVRTDSKKSAFELRFGRPQRLMAHLKLGVAKETKTVTAEEQRRIMKEAHALEDKAALNQKERYDKGREEVEYEKDDKVWLKEHDAGLFQAKRRGPFVIIEKKSNLNYLIAECGKAKLNNRHPIVNVRNLERYNITDEEEDEFQVQEVTKHREEEDGMTFKVTWVGGKKTWEPLESLYDVKDGKRIYNRQFEKYAQKEKIRLRRKE